ncbi:mediator of RNA polymerase II transcription subunit 7-like [Brevipalpus obovatus]|uniref:mediator of RNA polymerase II transcription subunit 7-like n=1 Tax=Brevipalpus obovatus TaxID=246614 RepID=UPI003D9EF402
MMTSQRSSSRSPILAPGKYPPNLVPTFPLPPNHLIDLYSDENIAKGRNPEPPKPIVDGSFSMYGEQITNDDTIIKPLEARQIKRLYPREYDHKRELKKMNASILVNFLDLLDVIIKCPDTGKREEKCSDIAMLFLQMHHLINELRPHQARETLRVTLNNQRRQRMEIINRLNKQIDKVIEMIVNCTTNIPDAPDARAALEQIIYFKSLNPFNQSESKDNCEKDRGESNSDPIDEFDSLMCDIVDQIS